jgi:hypothetical protein
MSRLVNFFVFIFPVILLFGVVSCNGTIKLGYFNNITSYAHTSYVNGGTPNTFCQHIVVNSTSNVFSGSITMGNWKNGDSINCPIGMAFSCGFGANGQVSFSGQGNASQCQSFLSKITFQSTSNDYSQRNLTVSCKNFIGDQDNCNFYINCTKGGGGGTIHGDPQFTGFYGQSYQVHGIPDRIFNIITSETLQLNGRFAYIPKGRITGEIDLIRSKINETLPQTAAWTHPGTYIDEIGIKFDFDQIYLLSGSYEHGFEKCEFNGENIEINAEQWVMSSACTKQDFEHECTAFRRVSTHILEVHTKQVDFLIVNSDLFFNIDSARLHQLNQQIDGLLGQSANSKNEIKSSHIESVYKFLINRGNVFSDDFQLNLFQQQQFDVEDDSIVDELIATTDV